MLSHSLPARRAIMEGKVVIILKQQAQSLYIAHIEIYVSQE